ncbi:hypothetical protein VMCG_10740 [Cytospora schulzeri]|uniref:Uncharacterized protein n=1 Tax=Cytospora schulzeri TaxID=448051 RepID=A0A423V8H8_9PEZI|nr:hypothetical protein VMCG_10740 [Valsa malicola]
MGDLGDYRKTGVVFHDPGSEAKGTKEAISAVPGTPDEGGIQVDKVRLGWAPQGIGNLADWSVAMFKTQQL